MALSVLCVTPHATDLEALPSLRLCRGCRDGLTKDLRALARLWHELGGVLGTGGSPRNGHRVSGSSSEPLPINPAVAEHRDQIKHDLVWWVLEVSRARGLTALPEDTVASCAAWLGRHVEWISAQPDTAEACPPVMRGLVARAHALVAPSGARRIEIGPCREVVDEERCPGTLYATVRAEDDVRPSVIYCGECRTEIGTEQWRRFGREYLREGRMAG